VRTPLTFSELPDPTFPHHSCGSSNQINKPPSNFNTVKKVVAEVKIGIEREDEKMRKRYIKGVEEQCKRCVKPSRMY